MDGLTRSRKWRAQRLLRFCSRSAVALLAASALLACAPSAPTSDSPSGTELNGTMRFHNVEGGCWAIELDNAQTVQPLNLTPEFQRDGLKIKVRLADAPGVRGVCQIGEMKNVVSIRPQ